MSREKKIGKVNDIKYGSVMVFLLAFLMLGSTVTNVIGSENNQNSQVEELCYFEIGEDSIDVTIPVGAYEIIKTTHYNN